MECVGMFNRKIHMKQHYADKLRIDFVDMMRLPIISRMSDTLGNLLWWVNLRVIENVHGTDIPEK